MSTWKCVERSIAKILGGTRVPVTGRSRGSAPDIEHATLSLEVKHRKSLPDWLKDALEQAEASKKEGQLPVAVLHETYKKYEDSLVVFRLRDFIKFIEGKGKVEDV